MKIQSLNALQAFEACARLGSAQKAAQQLHVTPSAISHQLRKLEDELEIELLHRSHRKIGVTDKGLQLQQTLNQAFKMITETLEDLRAGHRSNLVINVLPVFSIKWLSPRLLDFFQRFPCSDLILKNSYHLEDMATKKCDLAIRWGNGNWPGVYSEKILDEFVLPVLSPRLKADSGICNPQDILKLPLIQLFEEADHWQRWADLNGYPMPEDVRYIKCNDPVAALQAAIDGIGIALGPLTLVMDDIYQKRLITLGCRAVDSGSGYYLVAASEESLESEHVHLFAEWIKQKATEFSLKTAIYR